MFVRLVSVEDEYDIDTIKEKYYAASIESIEKKCM